MTNLTWIASVLLGLGVAVEAACTTKTPHKPWGALTQAEKDAYIEAELCIMKTPSKTGVAGAKTLWDDLQYNHAVQPHVMHDVGHFLPWHRYYVALHGHFLRDECGYTGPIPYWDETADYALADLKTSPVFADTAFGGDGAGSNRYLTSGPFANITLRMQRPGVATKEYKISRRMSSTFLSGASLSSLESCFQLSTYTTVWECLGGMPHSAGHGAAGGLMLDVALSPGDPVFYLHHGWLDVMWWKWQTLDLPARLTDIGGRRLARDSYIRALGFPKPGPEWTDYDGDAGREETTLAHVLYNSGLVPNVTVGDIMDVGGEAVCAEYFFGPSLNVTLNTVVDGIMVPVVE